MRVPCFGVLTIRVLLFGVLYIGSPTFGNSHVECRTLRRMAAVFMVDRNPQRSKSRLTPHLTSYTPPYAFTPILNPPNKSTLQTAIHKAPPKSHAEIPNTIQNQTRTSNPTPKSQIQSKTKAPNTIPSPKAQNNIRSIALTPHLTSYTPPTLQHQFLNPPNISTLQNTKTQSTSQKPIK